MAKIRMGMFRNYFQPHPPLVYPWTFHHAPFAVLVVAYARTFEIQLSRLHHLLLRFGTILVQNLAQLCPRWDFAMSETFYVTSWDVSFVCTLLFGGLHNISRIVLRYRLDSGQGRNQSHAPAQMVFLLLHFLLWALLFLGSIPGLSYAGHKHDMGSDGQIGRKVQLYPAGNHSLAAVPLADHAIGDGSGRDDCFHHGCATSPVSSEIHRGTRTHVTGFWDAPTLDICPRPVLHNVFVLIVKFNRVVR